MKKYHEVQEIRFDAGTMKIRIDGKVHAFSISAISSKLAKASQLERENLQVSPSGYGIHWQLLDEDLSVDGLLGIEHSPNRHKEKVSQLSS